MRTSKDTKGDERAAVELSNTVQLAVEALDGRQLSDHDLDALCDAALCERVRTLETAAKP